MPEWLRVTDWIIVISVKGMTLAKLRLEVGPTISEVIALDMITTAAMVA